MKNVRKKKRILIVVLTVAALLILTAVPVGLLVGGADDTPETPKWSYGLTGFTAREAETVPVDGALTVEAVGTYTGEFVEDGSDRQVRSVLALLVTNHGNMDLQYCSFQLGKDYYFELSNLPAGASALVMEQKGSVDTGTVFSEAGEVKTVYFSSKMEETLKGFAFSGMEGLLNVTNQGEARDSGFYIYYKNWENGVYIGGITYRVEVAGGMAAQAVCQLSCSHYSPDGSRIMMIG